jgi:transposase
MRLDRDDHSDVDSDVSKPHRPRRVEVLRGPERRRKWPDERKIAIVAETLEPGIVVSEVARRHEVSPSQLFGWLKQFRIEAQAFLDAKCPPERPVFAPAVVDTPPPVAPHALPALLPSVEPAVIEVSVGKATVRIRGAVDARTLAAVLKALKVLK